MSSCGAGMAFDRYMSATDLRSPPRITEPKPWLAWHLRGKLCDLRQLTLKEVFCVFDARVVDAAREARRRVDVDFSRGISRTTRVALRRAAENFFFLKGDSDVRRLLTEVKRDERVLRWPSFSVGLRRPSTQ